MGHSGVLNSITTNQLKKQSNFKDNKQFKGFPVLPCLFHFLLTKFPLFLIKKGNVYNKITVNVVLCRSDLQSPSFCRKRATQFRPRLVLFFLPTSDPKSSKF